MKPFLILQLRPETEASDSEYRAFLEKGGLDPGQARRLRLDQEALPEGLSLQDYAGVIVGGGSGCISDPPEQKSAVETRIERAVLGLMPEITNRDVPFLGCCYGIGILAHHLGAQVSKARYGERVGTADCTQTAAGRGDPLMAGLPTRFSAFVGHKEAVQDLPAGCAHLVSSDSCPYQMIRYARNVYATQFHPEADSDEFALRINIYRHRGYFPADEAEDMIKMCHAAMVDTPKRILQNFVSRYRQTD